MTKKENTVVEPTIGFEQISSLGEISCRMVSICDVVCDKYPDEDLMAKYKNGWIPHLVGDIARSLVKVKNKEDVRDFLRWFADAINKELDQYETKQRPGEK